MQSNLVLFLYAIHFFDTEPPGAQGPSLSSYNKGIRHHLDDETRSLLPVEWSFCFNTHHSSSQDYEIMGYKTYLTGQREHASQIVRGMQSFL